MLTIHNTRILHTLERMEERYDMQVTKQEILDIENRCINNCPLTHYIYNYKNELIFFVRFKGFWYPFGFDMARKHITTCLPFKYFGKYRKDLNRVKKLFVNNYNNQPDHPLWKHCNKHGKIDIMQIANRVEHIDE